MSTETAQLLADMADAIDPPMPDLDLDAWQARDHLVSARAVAITAQLRDLAAGADPAGVRARLEDTVARHPVAYRTITSAPA